MADINTYFRDRINQFHKNVYAKHTRGNPHRDLVPMSAYDLTEGTAPIVRTLTHELPTAYPTSLSDVGKSDGTGNPACNPSSTTIKRGETQRTFNLQFTSFKTDVVCLSDLKRAEQMAQAAADFERSLTEYVHVWWGDWYRVQNIKMVDNKVSTAASGGIDLKVNQEGNHTDCALPTADLSWDHLKALYWELVYNGIADELAVGRDSKGRPILPLMAGPGIIGSLWSGDTHVKEQVKYFDAAQNLKLLGYDGAINGFVPVLDLFPIRYGKTGDGIETSADLVEANFIYPTANANATVGRTHAIRSQYRTVARGGLAEYEVVTILGRNVWEAKYEATDPSSFSGMSFKPQNYMGEFQWIGGDKNKTFLGDNDRGNLGYYLADIRCGAKPIYPELGVSIVTNAKQA
jgi:hypothetical protein